MADVTIIDNGGANIASLRFALERLGASSMLARDAAALQASRRLILPGVGAAGDAMQRLRSLGLVDLIPRLTQPVLGICLGMQLLFERSDEDKTACLCVIPGAITRLEPQPGLPVPHMGWNTFKPLQPSALLRGLERDTHVYFVHGYAAPIGPWTVATTEYGSEFSAVVAHRNFLGVQFHPERSSKPGSRLLANFLELEVAAACA
jgi:glutamine amidotransferase